MTPPARRIARSLSVIQRKAERLHERDDLPERAAARRVRALDARNRLHWAHQRCTATSWNDPDHRASRDELRAAARAYLRAFYELVAVAWFFAEKAPPSLNLFAAWRAAGVDTLRPSIIQRHLAELHHLHLLDEADLFADDGVEALLGECDNLCSEFDVLARTAGWNSP